MSENITEKRLTILEYFDAYISHHYQSKTFLGPFVLLSLFYLIFSDIKMLFLGLSFIFFVLQSLGRKMIFCKILFPDIDLIFFSISIMNVSMLGSNFLESYVTPALPEVVSVHKFRQNSPAKGGLIYLLKQKRDCINFVPAQ